MEAPFEPFLAQRIARTMSHARNSSARIALHAHSTPPRLVIHASMP